MFHKKKGSIECEGIVVSFGKKSVSLYIPMFELMKEVMWDEMDIWKVNRNYKDEIVVCVHYDKKDARKDVNWYPKVAFHQIIEILKNFINFNLHGGMSPKTSNGFPSEDK